MWHALVILSIATAVCSSSENSHPLSRKLRTWHTLKQNDIRLHRHKRSLKDENSVSPVDKLISFNAFDRTFSLSLMVSPEVLTPAFKAYVHGKNGSNEVEVDKSTLLKGKVMDDPESHVTAHYDGKMLTASIQTEKETFVVEPMWRHLPEDTTQASNKSKSAKEDHLDMVVYRHSDLDLKDYQDPHGKGGFCNTKELMKSINRGQTADQRNQTDDEANSTNESTTRHRAKRSAGGSMKKICKLTLVADHRFYRWIGNNSTLETMYYLISLVERINVIYKQTNWDAEGETDIYTGYGFQINRIIVHNDSSHDSKHRYNQDKYWKAKDLLTAFSEVNNSVCLSHLFTYIDFPDGLLGLAYVGSESRNKQGGICTKPYRPEGGDPTYYLNTGVTSTVNWGKRILTTEADLVTAHELGHNFGADHDDDTTSNRKSSRTCTPGQSGGGNYIMFPAAVSGQYENNKKFSDCSKNAILPSLKYKADLCFHEDSASFCGNYQIEPENNETCDVGLFAVDDRCCGSNCRLVADAKCSNKNFPCCTDDCKIAGTKKMCRAGIPGLCYKDTYCNGINKTCPDNEPVANNTDCVDDGKCKGGICQQFCVTKGLSPCLCTEKEFQCKRCCTAVSSVENQTAFDCKPYLNENEKPIDLKENAPCTLGYCNGGVCQKHTQDVIERVWDIFQYIAPDKIGEFLADNIVGAVLVFSLLFWIPCSCLINFVDKKRLKERQKEDKWFNERLGPDFSRSFGGFRGVGTGSAPVTPRIRISRNNTNWISGGMALGSGFAAQEQWRASQERGMAFKKSKENIHGLAAVPGSPNDDDESTLSHSQPSLVNATGENNNRLVRSFPPSLSRSHPSLLDPTSPSLSENSFVGHAKPIAVSSNANLYTTDDSDCSILPQNDAVQYRPSLRRQGAVTTPN